MMGIRFVEVEQHFFVIILDAVFCLAPRKWGAIVVAYGATFVPLNISDHSPQEGGTKVKKKCHAVHRCLVHIPNRIQQQSKRGLTESCLSFIHCHYQLEIIRH